MRSLNLTFALRQFVIVNMLLTSIGFLIGACQQDYTPKPLGYNRLNLPTPSYSALPDSLPYRFEYSNHAKLLDDTSAISERFWIEIYYPELKANVHITYKPIRN